MLRRLLVLLAATAAALAVVLAPLDAATKRDFAAPRSAWTILPPGENGSLAFDGNTTDQAKLYDALTPKLGNVTASDIQRLFKPAPLGAAPAPGEKRERPKSGLLITRDAFGIAHVTGRTSADVAYGAGWVTAADRGLLLQLIRGPARAAALDVPGLDPLALALSGKSFVPSAEAESFLANQLDAVRAQGEAGKRLLTVVNAFAAGVNGYYKAKGIPAAPFTPNDVVASAALIASQFGTNGGQEVENAMFLDALEERLGVADARSVFADLREANDPEAPVTIPGSFPQELPSSPAPGSAVIDDGSFTGSPLNVPAVASNALLIGAKRSATGHPILVAGPQVGYFFPEFFAEMELSGGGFDVRGAVFPGVPYVLVGRGPDFAWSPTSSQADSRDLFVETLCDNDHTYLYRGQCEPMRRFFVGTLKAQGQPDQQVSYYETAHGPVIGYATVGGRRVAISAQRSTRGRELLSARAFHDLNTGRVTSAKTFLKSMSAVEFSFNWFYVDDRDIAYFSSGRLPVRAAGTDPALPATGTGGYDWRGFVGVAGHAQGVNPASGVILNWNNKPAANVGASDGNFAYGSVQRVDLLSSAISGRKKHTLVSVTGAMNKAATQDLRVLRVWPIVREVLRTGGSAPSARAEAAAALLDTWRAAGSSRLDRDLDGKIDDPGAAVMDAAWPRLANAVLAPVLGPLVNRLAELHGRSDDAGPGGSAYLSGWYGYVDKDLRSLLGKPVRAPFSRRYCGAGVLAVCRESLWAALDAAAAELESKQGPAPSSWRADATAERIRFTSGVLSDTMRWTNRPTFQQLMSFSSHRP